MKTTIEKILDATYRKFAENGYEGTSLTSIAREVGISKAALYHYFSSKEALFEQLYKIVIHEIGKSNFKKFKTLEDLREGLVEQGLSDIRYQKEDPYFASIIKQFYLLSMRNHAISVLTDELEKVMYQKYEALFKKACKLKIISEANVMIYIDLCLMMDNAISERIINNKDSEVESRWRYFINHMIK